MKAPRQMRTPTPNDALFGYLIPIAFILFAVYQLLTTGTIDKYIVGTLLILALGSLGWRLDLIFESYLRAKYQSVERRERDA